MTEFKRGDPIQFRGQDSVFIGRFLCYVDKLSWRDMYGLLRPEACRCLVQQDGTGMVFIKHYPTEDNRP